MKIFNFILSKAILVNGCDKGWTQDPSGNCLQMSQRPKNWEDAQNDCTQNDAHLLHVENVVYNDIVSSVQILTRN